VELLHGWDLRTKGAMTPGSHVASFGTHRRRPYGDLDSIGNKFHDGSDDALHLFLLQPLRAEEPFETASVDHETYKKSNFNQPKAHHHSRFILWNLCRAATEDDAVEEVLEWFFWQLAVRIGRNTNLDAVNQRESAGGLGFA